MTTPQEILDARPMHWRQIAAVAVTIGLNGLDGFDVLSISFASPGIATEWGIDRAALGVVLAMELIGMAIGSVLLGTMADRFGRRPTVLACLAVMAIGMGGATTASTVAMLSAWRVLTGLGIGGMLAATNAVATEFANARRRGLCLALMVIGYPLGAVLGGSAVVVLLKTHDWRIVFEVGAVVTLCFLPLVFWLVPETIPFLAGRQPPGALAQINRALARMGHPQVAVLPSMADRVATPFRALFAAPLIITTLLVTFAYFAQITTFYFILKWAPKIVVDLGFAPSAAARVLVWANIGGAIGGATFGLATRWIGLKPLTISALIGSFVFVALFGRGASDIGGLATAAALGGFFSNAGMVGLYSICARGFPTQLRAGGTGFAIGVGRGGAALSPVVAGMLFQGGAGLARVAIVMALGSLVSAVAVFALRISPDSTGATR